VGKPKSKSFRKSGVYIFTHKETNSKYVGFSNSLSRRLAQYFSDDSYMNKENTGQITSLIQKEGFKKFSLEIFVMSPEFSSEYYFLYRRSNIIF
jgi:excinuclease UvrABC nuclease subunit